LFRDSVLGDLEEGFFERMRRRSAAYATMWYWVHASRVGLRYLLERTVNRRISNRPWDRKPARRHLVESTIQDVRFAFRTLRKRPLFTTVAVLTLGLGIGATTAMFSVVNGVLLKPLPYDEPGRLVAVWRAVPQLRRITGVGTLWDRTRFTYTQYRDLREQSTVYEGLAAYRAGNLHVATQVGSGEPAELPAGDASASLLPVLGVSPILGRWFLPGEEASRAGDDGASVAVMSYELWQGRFGGSQEALGSIVTIDNRPYAIVGILPPEFRVHWLSASFAGESVPTRRDVWFPIGAPGWAGLQGANSFEVIGRLRSGVSFEQASAESRTILSTHPQSSPEDEVRVIARASEETHGLASPLVLLFGATAFLLLIACGNIATLSMAEVLSRRHEIATRSAIGAGGWRILRLLMTESFVLAALGSAVGAMVAFGGTGLLVALAPPLPRLDEVGVDLRVLGFAALLGTCTAFLFGTLPSVMATRGAVGPSIASSARAGSGRRRFAGSVIAIEVAMTAMLLVSAGLLTRSLGRLLAVDPGFDSKDLTAVEVSLPRYRYSTREARTLFLRDAIDRLEAIPGIGTVSAVARLPFPGYTSGWGIRIVGRDESNGPEPNVPLGYPLVPGYLETMGVPLLAGRPLTDTDRPGAPLAVVINETMARRYWPDESPIGAQYMMAGHREPVTVVGVVGDMKRKVLDAEPEPTFFIPFSQLNMFSERDICFVARTALEPRVVLPLMRDAVWAVDGNLPIKNATTVDALIAESADHERYGALLVSVFGILAALLAAAGVFGITARSVALRRRELGIRMALGARGSGLVGMTMRSILITGVVGTAVGLTGALWSSRLLARFLFEIEPLDPATYGVVAALITIVCLTASYAPARRITRVNPVEVLRAE
jgi:putative ABC transport system permease protein